MEISEHQEWAVLMRCAIRLDKWIAKLERSLRHGAADGRNSIDLMGLNDALSLARADRPILLRFVEDARLRLPEPRPERMV